MTIILLEVGDFDDSLSLLAHHCRVRFTAAAPISVLKTGHVTPSVLPLVDTGHVTQRLSDGGAACHVPRLKHSHWFKCWSRDRGI